MGTKAILAHSFLEATLSGTGSLDKEEMAKGLRTQD